MGRDQHFHDFGVLQGTTPYRRRMVTVLWAPFYVRFPSVRVFWMLRRFSVVSGKTFFRNFLRALKKGNYFPSIMIKVM